MAELTKQQKMLFNDLHRSRLEDNKVLNKKQFRGIWNSVIEKYPESAHFVYELLQNADDAEATEVYIIVNKHEMIFKHNGAKHFDITAEDAIPVGDINSITGIGDSSKTEKENKIGKFGVGFKAVFQYTNTPEIYDDYFKFKIENYIVPTLLSHDHPDRTEGETLFLFPFKNGEESYSDIVQRLERLQNPILFLRNLKRIKWRIDHEPDRKGKVHTYSKKLIERHNFEDDSWLEIYRLKDGSGIKSIFLFSENIIIKSENKELPISVGYYYDEVEKKLITDTTQNIFCFFPTRETFKTCFISHAPFLLTDNRQHLKPNNEYNKSLIGSLAELAAKAVLRLRDYGKKQRQLLIDENLTSIVPQYKKNYFQSLDELFEKPIHDAFKEIIETEAVFLSRNGKYLKKSESYIGTPKELVSLLAKKQLSSLIKPSGLTEDQIEIDFIKWDLSQNIANRKDKLFTGIHSFTSWHLGRYLYLTPGFMAQQDLKWVVRLYNYLRLHASQQWKITDTEKSQSTSDLIFRSAPIIKTQKGEWVAPFLDKTTPNVYLPLKKDITSGYNFISEEYVENQSAMLFFEDLKIKEPNQFDYIQSVILTKFRGESFEVDDDDLKSDFEVLISYFLSIQDKKEKEEYLRLLKEKLYLVSSNGFLEPLSKLYFKSPLLKRYFDNDVIFVDIDFYKSTVEKYGLDTVKDILALIGVKTHPSVLPVTRYDISDVPSLSRPLFQYYDSISSRLSIHDFELDGFGYSVSKSIMDKELSLYIWNQILPTINLSQYSTLSFNYWKKYARHYEEVKDDSSFKYSLIRLKWVFNIDGNVVAPHDIYLEDLDPEYNRDRAILDFLGLVQRPTEQSIIALGGTADQQRQQEIGALVEQLGLTEDDLERMARIKETEAGQLNLGSKYSTDLIVNQEELNRNSEGKHIDTFGLSSCKESSKLEDLFDDDMDVSIPEDKAKPTKDSESTSSNQSRIEDIKQQLEEESKKKLQREEIRQEAEKLEKYSKEWFQKKLELEYRDTRDNDTSTSIKRSISISFSKILVDRNNNRLYELRNPSRDIPLWVEEVENLTIKFLFNNREELPCSFEVANVKDFSLRLKAKASDADSLSSIDWTKLTQATIDINNPTNLVDNFRRAFYELDLHDGFNLKENLGKNLSFVFGPPGTGKTTYLAKFISEYISSNKPNARILVLAPTNKACDVLANKIFEFDESSVAWLGRFITTGDPQIEDNGLVCDRNSELFKNDKCCIITTMARLPYDGFQNVDGIHNIKDIDWDLVICDEASMLPIAQIVYAIYKFKDVPFLVAGDPKQIAPIDISDNWNSENIYDMIQLKSFENPTTEPVQFDITNLDTQFRAVPAIGNLFSDFAYGGRLKHYRQQRDQKPLNIPELPLKSVSYIPFRVENFDSMFGAKRLSKSSIHIYSALLATELSKFIAKKYAERNQGEDCFEIGIICPYAPQAQLIEKMLEQVANLPDAVRITTGTIHSFQGDQCNIVITVFNPPYGLRYGATNTHLNNLNIINVAISRAKDYLIILMPDKESCEGFDNLTQIKRLGAISSKHYRNMTTVIPAQEIEKTIFGKTHYLELNTFVTSHQLANVYTKPTCLYEIRVDEKSVDIQIGK